ncbi:DNA repair protein RecO [Asaccharospora irregularis]|uniref:DNA repair protein RecO n=1 Tax=Asaccharospora irregularis DSM 2635 TaxID=1121321 RepID=A0A1M5M828_9FIRM|nr:DNA repair protein RecO [Asaccharospora irregularis]SHG73129.1 DNA replication and repair protein RecO [Asaccharospora irregularis DSM 2635]
MIILNTQGIVLKSVRYKENDVILTLFTRKLGKVAAIAKGAKRNKSALLSSAQIFAYGNYTLKRNGNMYRVTQSDIIKSFYDISYDIEAFSYATYITKLVEGATLENQTNNRLFVLLAQTLYLYTQESTDKMFITAAFELKFLDYIGFRPVVRVCSNCSSKDLNGSTFNIYEGGILCSKCSQNFEGNLKIDLTTIKLMEYIINNDILACSKAKVSKYLVYELSNILQKYLKVYVDNIDLKALYFLKSIQNDKGVEKDE